MGPPWVVRLGFTALALVAACSAADDQDQPAPPCRDVAFVGLHLDTDGAPVARTTLADDSSLVALGEHAQLPAHADPSATIYMWTPSGAVTRVVAVGPISAITGVVGLPAGGFAYGVFSVDGTPGQTGQWISKGVHGRVVGRGPDGVDTWAVSIEGVPLTLSLSADGWITTVVSHEDVSVDDGRFQLHGSAPRTLVRIRIDGSAVESLPLPAVPVPAGKALVWLSAVEPFGAELLMWTDVTPENQLFNEPPDDLLLTVLRADGAPRISRTLRKWIPEWRSVHGDRILLIGSLGGERHLLVLGHDLETLMDRAVLLDGHVQGADLLPDGRILLSIDGDFSVDGVEVPPFVVRCPLDGEGVETSCTLPSRALIAMLDASGHAAWAQRVLADRQHAPMGVGGANYGGAVRLDASGRVVLLGGGGTDHYRMTCVPR